MPEKDDDDSYDDDDNYDDDDDDDIGVVELRRHLDSEMSDKLFPLSNINDEKSKLTSSCL